MRIARRFTAVVAAAFVLVGIGLPAHAEDVDPVKRVSCPSVARLNSLSVSFAGARGPLLSLTSTPVSCRYTAMVKQEDGSLAPGVVLSFDFADQATPAETQAAIAASWPVDYGYSFHPNPMPALGPGAFNWADASPLFVYWQLAPGAVGTLFGISDHDAAVIRTAREFRPMMEVYTIAGERTVNGRQWRTTCENYSATVRCRTDIMASIIKRVGPGKYKQVNEWTFNSLTYRWAPRALWAGNPLAQNTSWTAADGRKWKTECDTPTTGVGACRSYTWSTELGIQGGRIKQYDTWVFNNQVLFSD